MDIIPLQHGKIGAKHPISAQETTHSRIATTCHLLVLSNQGTIGTNLQVGWTDQSGPWCKVLKLSFLSLKYSITVISLVGVTTNNTKSVSDNQRMSIFTVFFSSLFKYYSDANISLHRESAFVKDPHRGINHRNLVVCNGRRPAMWIALLRHQPVMVLA